MEGMGIVYDEYMNVIEISMLRMAAIRSIWSDIGIYTSSTRLWLTTRVG